MFSKKNNLEELSQSEQILNQSLSTIENAEEEIKCLKLKIEILEEQRDVYKNMLKNEEAERPKRVISSPLPSMIDEKIDEGENEDECLQNIGSLEIHLDKLNTNIETLKKAFLNFDLNNEVNEDPEFRKDFSYSESNHLHGDSNYFNDFSSERNRRKISMLEKTAEGNIDKRRYQSYGLKKENIENIVDSSTFSLMSLQRKIKELPLKIKHMEEENAFLREQLNEYENKKERVFSLNEKIQKVQLNPSEEMIKSKAAEISELNKTLEEKKKEIQILNNKIDERKVELQNVNAAIEKAQKNKFNLEHYCVNSLKKEEDSCYLTHGEDMKDRSHKVQNKDCCEIF